MGSVQDIVKCHQCGYEEAITDYHYNTGEEFIFCPICCLLYTSLHIKLLIIG